MADPEQRIESANAPREFVTFIVGDEDFAVPLAEVKEIIRLPNLVRAPLSPPCLAGLANLRGQVLPTVSLRRVFAMPDRDADDATRVVVFDVGRPIGLIVDRMRAVTTVPADRIEDMAGLSTTVDTELLRGIIKSADGKHVTLILAVETLLQRQFGNLAKAEETKATEVGVESQAGSRKADETNGSTGDGELQLVSFTIAGQEYALPIQEVQEIVQRPERINPVPSADGNVLGVMTLRDRILPLVSLHAMFGLMEPETDERSRVVVVGLADEQSAGNVAGFRIGLTTDSVREVLRVPRSTVEATPPAIARTHGMSDVESFCRLDGGNRLVSILSARALLEQGIREHGSNEESKAMAADNDSTAAGDEERQLVIFRLMEEEYGVPIQAVQEIVRIPDVLTRMPKTPDFVEGVVNLRGSVLPVVDNRKRLNLPSLERNERQRIMVFSIGGVRTGFIVDAVTEVIRIKERCISPAPELSSEQRELFKEIADPQGNGRMILVLDPEKLLSSVQLDQARKLAA